uniref:Uncharacterized protein n=1 Tax=Streptomyces sp. NBC_00093 TaxID=2975649 RepID=A0AAU2AEJ1_9ACTN
MGPGGDLGKGSARRGALAMAELGGYLILAGTDHPLFLLILLLPAPLRDTGAPQARSTDGGQIAACPLARGKRARSS